MQIFVRAFDLDERLVGVAFLDVGVYVTSLRAVKNLLVIGDAVKSVWFVAFQVGYLRRFGQGRLLIDFASCAGGSVQARDPRKGPSPLLHHTSRPVLRRRACLSRDV